jgi:hypothetical protein
MIEKDQQPTHISTSVNFEIKTTENLEDERAIQIQYNVCGKNYYFCKKNNWTF